LGCKSVYKMVTALTKRERRETKWTQQMMLLFEVRMYEGGYVYRTCPN